jgi:hypothetical protein
MKLLTSLLEYPMKKDIITYFLEGVPGGAL